MKYSAYLKSATGLWKVEKNVTIVYDTTPLYAKMLNS